jgi:hypothetical protein
VDQHALGVLRVAEQSERDILARLCGLVGSRPTAGG